MAIGLVTKQAYAQVHCWMDQPFSSSPSTVIKTSSRTSTHAAEMRLIDEKNYNEGDDDDIDYDKNCNDDKDWL